MRNCIICNSVSCNFKMQTAGIRNGVKLSYRLLIVVSPLVVCTSPAICALPVTVNRL